ncbi:MAG: SigE family RNA polymerase sigma factor [Frankia sp.]
MTDEQHSRVEFHAFFERYHAEMARFAYLLTGERDAAEDLAADAFVAVWRRWDTVRNADLPVAYLRRTIANLAITRIRRLIRERRGLGIVGVSEDRCYGPDVPAVIDVRAALSALPARKRACVVMRFAFDLSEEDTARTLGISVGTVKSQTSKGLAELTRLLGPGSGSGAKVGFPVPGASATSTPNTSTPSTSGAGTPDGRTASKAGRGPSRGAVLAGRTGRPVVRRVGVEPRSVLRGRGAV